MQTLWARVAQVRGSCRCPQCLHGAHGVVSRLTTASANRRTPTYITSSTLWYSGIFATAATFDAASKKERREQWDHAIAEVKQDLALPAGEELRVEKPHAEEQSRTDEVPDADNVHFSPLGEIEHLEAYLDTQPSRPFVPQWPANTGSVANPHHLPPQSIYASGHSKSKQAQTRWVPKKIETVQLSIDLLQLQLFHSLHLRGWTQEAASSVPADYGEKLLMLTEDLQAAMWQKRQDAARLEQEDHRAAYWRRTISDTPLCRYHQDDHGEFHSITRVLNRSLQELFKRGETGELSKPHLLAKVCYNLSISSAPPNVDTYNTLILGLWRAGEPLLVGDVLRSFSRSRMRPNEVSLAAILGFYTDIDRVDQFTHWLALMRGKNGGLYEARPDIKITEAGASRLLRVEGGMRTKVIQLPYPTPMVFGALIKGILKFSGFGEALKVCQNMGEEGWGLCMGGVGPLLKDCALRSDWSSGLAVWQQIQTLKSRSRIVTKRGWTTETIGLPTFVSMLQLCFKCGRRDTFEDVMDQAMQSHGAAADDLKKLMGSKDDPLEPWDNLTARTDAEVDADNRQLSRLGEDVLLDLNDALKLHSHGEASAEDYVAPATENEQLIGPTGREEHSPANQRDTPADQPLASRSEKPDHRKVPRRPDDGKLLHTE